MRSKKKVIKCNKKSQVVETAITLKIVKTSVTSIIRQNKAHEKLENGSEKKRKRPLLSQTVKTNAESEISQQLHKPEISIKKRRKTSSIF